MRLFVTRDGVEQEVHIHWRPVVVDKVRSLLAKVPVKAAWTAVAILLLLGSFGLGKASSGGGCTMPSFEGCHLPIPDPSPQPGSGLQSAVLIYESSEDRTSPALWGDKDVQAYLLAKVPSRARLLDKDTDVTNGPDWVKAAMAVPRPSVPSLVLQDAKGQWFIAALPKTAADVLALLKKQGG